MSSRGEISRLAACCLALAVGGTVILPASAAEQQDGVVIVTETIDYGADDKVMEGFVAYDAGLAGRRPAVLVVHEWYGLNDFARQKAQQLAEMGYLAFAVDMYGKGIRATDAQSAAKLAGEVKGDRALMRARARAALDEVRRHRLCDPAHVAAIGFCFGGTTVLELARTGADVAGVVSFHGGLDTPLPAQAGEVKAQVLILHGAADPHVPADHVAALQAELDAAGVAWQLIAYSAAVHSFTNPAAGDDPARGAAYDARAARRAWAAMQAFLAELFG